MYVLMGEQGVWLTRSIRRNAKPWIEEKNLVHNAKGFPWDYQLGTLGSKVFLQSKQCNPKPAEDAEVVFEARESLTGNLVLPHLPPPEHQSQPESMPSVAGQPAPPSTLSAAPSSRPTLRLDKPKRSEGEGAGSGPSAGPMPESVSFPGHSPMDVAATPPVTPLPPPIVEMQDSDMLIDVAERIKQAQAEAGAAADSSARPEKFQRVARVGVSEYPINDDMLESALEWEDAEVYLSLGGDDTGEWDIPETTEDWKSLIQEDCFWLDRIPELSEQQMKELDEKADAFEFQRLIRMNIIEVMPDMLERDREGLYSPATSSTITKVLPWLLCEWRKACDSATDDDTYSILALDIKDAYLKVPQL